MASRDEAVQALTDAIASAAPDVDHIESRARAVLALAEARAWLINANQPHGGQTVSTN
jgi:hypothetical protein